MAIFCHNTHNRYPIARPWGRAMGYLLWVHKVSSVLPLSLSLSWSMWHHVILERVITYLNRVTYIRIAYGWYWKISYLEVDELCTTLRQTRIDLRSLFTVITWLVQQRLLLHGQRIIHMIVFGNWQNCLTIEDWTMEFQVFIGHFQFCLSICNHSSRKVSNFFFSSNLNRHCQIASVM